MQPADNRPVHTSGSEAASDSTFRAVKNLFCKLEAKRPLFKRPEHPQFLPPPLSDLPPPSTALRKRQHTPERIGKTAARFAERREARARFGVRTAFVPDNRCSPNQRRAMINL